MTDLTPLMLDEARWERAWEAAGALYDRTDGDTHRAVKAFIEVADREWRAARDQARAAADALLDGAA